MKFQRLKEGFPLFFTCSAVLTIGVLFFWFTEAEAILDIADAPPGADVYPEESAALDAVIAEEGVAPITTIVPPELEDTIAAQEANTNPPSLVANLEPTAEPVEEGITLNTSQTNEVVEAVAITIIVFCMMLGIAYAILKRTR